MMMMMKSEEGCSFLKEFNQVLNQEKFNVPNNTKIKKRLRIIKKEKKMKTKEMV